MQQQSFTPENVPFGQLLGGIFNDPNHESHIDSNVTMWRFPDIPQVAPWVPKDVPNYYFRKELLISARNFLLLPNGDALFLTGPTGSGKTSFISVLASRCRWPVQSVTCNARFEFASLVGQYVLQSSAPGQPPSMRWRYGPLATAMKMGHILLLNEIDLADAAELTAFNDIVEGRPLIIAENGGEIIHPHPSFRIIFTANSNGTGDHTGAYSGINAMNMAFMDRCRILEVPYMTEQEEVNLIQSLIPVDPGIVQKKVQIANQQRDAHINGKGTPMSTRVLIRWCNLTAAYRNMPGGMRTALQEAFLRRLEPSEAIAADKAVEAVFGSLYTGDAA